MARKSSQSGRGSLGVGVALGEKAFQAWVDAGSKVYGSFGPCAMAVRLLVQNDEGRDVGTYLVSDAAPAAAKSRSGGAGSAGMAVARTD